MSVAGGNHDLFPGRTDSPVSFTFTVDSVGQEQDEFFRLNIAPRDDFFDIISDPLFGTIQDSDSKCIIIIIIIIIIIVIVMVIVVVVVVVLVLVVVVVVVIIIIIIKIIIIIIIILH